MTVGARRPSEILAEHRDEVLALIAQRGLKDPRVFGSVARGTDGSGSDLDILVRVPRGRALAFASLGRELSEMLNVRVDVLSEGGLKQKHAALRMDLTPL